MKEDEDAKKDREKEQPQQTVRGVTFAEIIYILYILSLLLYRNAAAQGVGVGEKKSGGGGTRMATFSRGRIRINGGWSRIILEFQCEKVSVWNIKNISPPTPDARSRSAIIGECDQLLC